MRWRAEQMRAAVLNRDLIGQAKGIFDGTSPDPPPMPLSPCSPRPLEHKNVKLAEVAACLVETGELTGSPDPGQSDLPG